MPLAKFRKVKGKGNGRFVVSEYPAYISAMGRRETKFHIYLQSVVELVAIQKALKELGSG